MRHLVRRLLLLLGYIFHHNNDSKVVYYHDVGKIYTCMGTEFTQIKKHLETIISHKYEIVTEISRPQGQVMICFDDGWAGIYDYKEEFIKLGVYPTIFIAVDLIDKNGYLSSKQIFELESLGFKFMAHSWSHKDLTMFNEDELRHELKDSKDWFESTYRHPFDAICFPMGMFSNKVIQQCLKYGYTLLFTSLPGGFYEMHEQGLICRNCAQNFSHNEFKWMLNGNSYLFKRRLFKQHFKN